MVASRGYSLPKPTYSVIHIAVIFLALAAVVALKADDLIELVAAAFLALFGVALILAREDAPPEVVW